MEQKYTFCSCSQSMLLKALMGQCLVSDYYHRLISPPPSLFVLKSLNMFWVYFEEISFCFFFFFLFLSFHFAALSTVEITLSHVVAVHCAF